MMQNDPEKYEVQTWTLPELFAQNVMLRRKGDIWFIVIYGNEMQILPHLGEHLAQQIADQHLKEEKEFRESEEFREWKNNV